MSSYSQWECPYCSGKATIENTHRIICESLGCSCGAIALAAPAVDQDEIIDDALNIYRIKLSEKAKGYNSLMIEEIKAAGIDVKEGQSPKINDSLWGEYISLWFKVK